MARMAAAPPGPSAMPIWKVRGHTEGSGGRLPPEGTVVVVLLLVDVVLVDVLVVLVVEVVLVVVLVDWVVDGMVVVVLGGRPCTPPRAAPAVWAVTATASPTRAST